MPDTSDLLDYAINKNPVEFADTFDQLIRQRALDAIESKRIEIAQSIYGSDDEEDIDDYVPEDDDDVDLELDLELDLDDLDLDIDDLDLDDYDGDYDGQEA